MMAKNFEMNDLVWAKMKGYPPWPGKIVCPPPASKTKPKKYHHYVYFFGSNNYAWIADENIHLHSEELVKKYSNKKTGIYLTAIETIIACSKGVSKYHKSNESSESDKNASETKEQKNNLEKIANRGIKPKSKNLQSNSTPSKKMKKLPLKKLSSVKKLSLEKKTARKRTHSSDQIKPNKHSTSYFFQRILDSVPSRSIKIEEDYPELMSNVPPNIGYHCLSEPILNMLERKYFDLPDAPPIDLSYQRDFLKEEVMETTNEKIGFLGFNKIGQGIVKNLCQSGHSVIIWSQIRSECQQFAEKFNNVKIARTPADVVKEADITFSCFYDEHVAKQIVFGNCGVLKELERSGDQKGYVEMTTMDPIVSLSIALEIKNRRGRYLEAHLCGSRVDANEGTLFILTAGDETLYNDCKSCFDAISKTHKFVSTDVGGAFNLGLIRSMLVATVYAAVAESLAFTSKIGLKGDVVVDVIKDAVVNNENFVTKAKSMLSTHYISNTPLKQVQRDLYLGLLIGDKFAQPTPIFATVNEIYKRCKSMGYGDHDVSAVYEASKFCSKE